MSEIARRPVLRPFATQFFAAAEPAGSGLRRRFARGLAAIVLGAFALSAAPRDAGAQAPPSGGPSMSNGCIQDVWRNNGNSQNLQCTANDIELTSVANVRVTDPCTGPTDTVTFLADLTIVTTANERYDLGFYFSEDTLAAEPAGGSDGALTGQCWIQAVPYAPDTPYLDLDQTERGQADDQCGDINTAHSPMLFRDAVLTASCRDFVILSGAAGQDGYVDLDWCAS